MAVMEYLVLGFIILTVIGYLINLLRTVIVVATFLLAAYLLFFTDYLVLGILVAIGWLVLASAFGKCEDDAKKKDYMPVKAKKPDSSFYTTSIHDKRKKTSKRGINYNYLLLWLIPLFWPFLIFQTFFRDKPAGVLNEYDYEQHLKSNRK